MIIDQDGNQVKDGDWVGFNITGMARGQVMFASDSDLSLADNTPAQKFINVMIQIPCIQGTSKLPAVSKIFGPSRPQEG